MLAGVQKGVRCRCPVVVYVFIGNWYSVYRYYFSPASILKKKSMSSITLLVC